MLKIVNKILEPLPSVARFKTRLVRRIAIVIFLPIELVLAPFRGIRDTVVGAIWWWKQP